MADLVNDDETNGEVTAKFSNTNERTKSEKKDSHNVRIDQQKEFELFAKADLKKERNPAAIFFFLPYFYVVKTSKRNKYHKEAGFTRRMFRRKQDL